MRVPLRWQLNALFNACFRIQREASEAAGRHIPMVVENVKGAQPWVGRAQANFGSFYLWGDVRSVGGRIITLQPKFGQGLRAARRGQKFNPDGTEHPQGSWFAVADSKERGANGQKVEGFNFHQHENGGPGGSFQSAAVQAVEGVKQGGDWFSGYGGGFGWDHSQMRMHSSKSPARKAASAMIAKIPFDLASHIARCFKPAAVQRSSVPIPPSNLPPAVPK